MSTFRKNVRLGTVDPLWGTDDFAKESITTEKIADGAITEEKIAAGAIKAEELADDFQVTDEMIKEGTLYQVQQLEQEWTDAESARATAESARVSAEDAREAQSADDHTQASEDHSTASDDHTQAQTDHDTASDDHTNATTDHSTAHDDHTQAGTDHDTATEDHTTATSDHETADADHTQALADHEVMQGYDDRLTEDEASITDLAQEVNIGTDAVPSYPKDVCNVVENPEFKKVEVDADDNIISSIDNNDVRHDYLDNVFHGDLRLEGDLATKDGKSLVNSIVAKAMYTIENDEWLSVTISKEGYVLEGIKTDGTKYISSASLSSDEEDIEEIKKDIKSIKSTDQSQSSSISILVNSVKENTEAIQGISPIEVTNNGTIENLPDNEDLTEVNNVLKFNDRTAGNGKGYKILRTNGLPAPDDESIIQLDDDTIYEVRYMHDISDASYIKVGSGSSFNFNGGKFIGGYIKNYNGGIVKPEWFGAVGDGVTDDSDAIIMAFKTAEEAYAKPCTVEFECKKYLVSKTIDVIHTNIEGNGCRIINNSDSKQPVFNIKYAEVKDLHIEHITIDCNKKDCIAINVYEAINLIVSHFYIENLTYIGVNIEKSHGSGSLTYEIQLEDFNILGSLREDGTRHNYCTGINIMTGDCRVRNGTITFTAIGIRTDSSPVIEEVHMWGYTNFGLPMYVGLLVLEQTIMGSFMTFDTCIYIDKSKEPYEIIEQNTDDIITEVYNGGCGILLCEKSKLACFTSNVFSINGTGIEKEKIYYYIVSESSSPISDKGTRLHGSSGYGSPSDYLKNEFVYFKSPTAKITSRIDTNPAYQPLIVSDISNISNIPKYGGQIMYLVEKWCTYNPATDAWESLDSLYKFDSDNNTWIKK